MAAIGSVASSSAPRMQSSSSVRRLTRRSACGMSAVGRSSSNSLGTGEFVIASQHGFWANPLKVTVVPRSAGRGRRRPLHVCSLIVKQNGSDVVTACKFAPDGETIVSASRDTKIKIWGVASGTCQATLEGHRYLSWFVQLRRQTRGKQRFCLRPLPAQRGRGVEKLPVKLTC